MVPVEELVGHLDDLLRPEEFDDYGPNGLQVPGAEAADTVVTGVSASAELFVRAREAGAGLVLVHHGLFWAGPPRALDPAAKRRLQLLFEADLALAAYHLPLDAHLEVGNNALLARALGAGSPEPFGPHNGRGDPVVVEGGADADHLEDAIAQGLDAFLTGEPAERVMTRADEAGIHFLAAGHYATETFGVQALGERLAGRFGVRHVFVDVPNPI